VLLRGTGVSVKTAFLMFLTEAVVLVLFAIVVLVRAHSALGAPFHATGGAPGGFAGIGGLTFSLAVFAYVGWENNGHLWWRPFSILVCSPQGQTRTKSPRKCAASIQGERV